MLAPHGWLLNMPRILRKLHQGKTEIGISNTESEFVAYFLRDSSASGILARTLRMVSSVTGAPTSSDILAICPAVPLLAGSIAD